MIYYNIRLSVPLGSSSTADRTVAGRLITLEESSRRQLVEKLNFQQ